MQLMPETLFLTMNVIDRFLEQKPMTRKNLQLVRIRSNLCSIADYIHFLHSVEQLSSLTAGWCHCHVDRL